MVAELVHPTLNNLHRCSLAKISMVAELGEIATAGDVGCSLAKISMVAELSLKLQS